jgi:hypothetical protein
MFLLPSSYLPLRRLPIAFSLPLLLYCSIALLLLPLLHLASCTRCFLSSPLCGVSICFSAPIQLYISVYAPNSSRMKRVVEGIRRGSKRSKRVKGQRVLFNAPLIRYKLAMLQLWRYSLLSRIYWTLGICTWALERFESLKALNAYWKLDSSCYLTHRRIIVTVILTRREIPNTYKCICRCRCGRKWKNVT